MMHRSWAPFLLFFLLPCLPAFALAGDVSSVLSHCGAPSSDYQSVSPVTGQPERNLTYDSVILHFQPSTGSWSYLSAWEGHMPVSEAHVAKKLPCFADAMASSKASSAVPDPTIAADQSSPVAGIRFGKAFLWLLFALAAILIVSLSLPATRQRRSVPLPLEARPFRRPRVVGVPFRRKRPTPQHSSL